MDSQQYEQLKILKKGIFGKDHYVDFVQYQSPKKKDFRILIITSEHLIMIENNLNMKKGFNSIDDIKVISFYDIEDCNNIEIVQDDDSESFNTLKLCLKKECKEVYEELCIDDDLARNRVFENIRNLRQQKLLRAVLGAK